MEKQITMIPAKPKRAEAANEKNKLRVCCYARVSTDRDEQESSYEAQQQHYEDLIRRNPEWEYAGMYADEQSGMNTKKREGFKRMIDDCRKGKIDMIVTKSISRFSRNIVDTISYLRELNSLDICVYFEKENLYSNDEKGNIILTIMASIAEQESRSISQNVKLGLKYKYQRGEFMLNYKRFLGYTMDENNNLMIVPEEAETVRRIFREFIAGRTEREIAHDLTEEGIKTGAGNTSWHATSILRILKNVKYKGDVITQITCTTDVLNKVRERNRGFEPQYYISNDHEPIVSNEDFMIVQVELARRHRLACDNGGARTVRRGMSEFTQKVSCGLCDATYTRQIFRGNKRHNYWKCNTRVDKGPEACDNNNVCEEEMEYIVLSGLNNLLAKPPMGKIEKAEKTIGGPFDADALDRKVKSLREAHDVLVSEMAEATEVAANEEEQEDMLVDAAERRLDWIGISRLRAFLQDGKEVSEYTPDLTKDMVKAIKVFPDHYIVDFGFGIESLVEKDTARWPATVRHYAKKKNAKKKNAKKK